jgi:hypothetical protein
MAAEDVINTAYLSTLGRPADPEGLAFYSAQLEAGRPVGEILADLNFAVESGTENVLMNKLAQPLDISKIAAGFTAPTPEIAADLIGRSQTVGVPTSEFDRYGGYQAVKDVYNASGGASVAQPRVDPASVQTIDLDLPTRPSVDATNTSLATPSTQLESNPFFPTLQVREDVNYDQLFGAKPLDQGGQPLHRKQSTGHLKPFTTGLLTLQASKATCRAARAWSRSMLT